VRYAVNDGQSHDSVDYTFSVLDSGNGASLVWHAPGNMSHVIESMLYGAYNVPNIASAVTIGLYFGVEVKDIAGAIKSYRPSNNRSQVVLKDGKTVLLDAYNANPVSMELAVSDLANRPESKSLILGGMNELGDHSNGEHVKLLNFISQFEWEEVILVGKHFKEIHRDFDFLWFEVVEDCQHHLDEHVLAGEVVLLKGSRSLQLELLLDHIK